MRDVFERAEELRAEFLADAQTLTDQMTGGTPLADLHTARRQLIEQLADIDARITQREPLERAHADALRMADGLAREITAGRRMNAPLPAADAHRAGGMPPADLRDVGVPSPVAVWVQGAAGSGGWACKVCSRPLGDDGICGEHSHIGDLPVAGHATTDTAADRPPFRGEAPTPTPEVLESGAPITTCTDLTEPDTDGPRHAAPRDRTGPMRVLSGLGRTDKNGGPSDG